MPLETASTAAELNEAWPTSGDPKSQGDDHIRLLKQVVKADVARLDAADSSASDDLAAAVASLQAEIAQLRADALLESEVVNKLFPINSVFLTYQNRNPGSFIGGTWAQIAQGRALVGVGNNGQASWTLGQTRGQDSVTLTAGQIPSHTHFMPARGVSVSGTTGAAGGHSHQTLHTQAFSPWGYSGGQDGRIINTDGSSFQTHANTSPVGDHVHGFAGSGTAESGTTGAAGSGGAHDNVQPSIAVYVWRRTG